MEIRIVAEAEFELGDAIARYEEIESGLGVRLKDEARAAIAWIGEHPMMPRLRPKGYRRVNLVRGRGKTRHLGEIHTGSAPNACGRMS